MIPLVLCLLILPMVAIGGKECECEEQRFATNANLYRLLDTEKQVLTSLRIYIKRQTKKINFIEKYLGQLKTEYEVAMKNIPYYFGNPINAYIIIKRLVPDLQFINYILKYTNELQPPKAVVLPTKDDIFVASKRLRIMSAVYNLNVSHLANGVLNHSRGQSVSTPMTASDCYSVGISLFKSQLYKDSIPWLEESYYKMEGIHSEVYPVSKTAVIDTINNANYELGDLKNIRKWMQKLKLFKPHYSESFDLYDYVNVLRKNSTNRGIKKKHQKINGTCMKLIKSPESFRNICDRTPLINKTSNLSCYYAHGPHPMLMLAPLKAERLHRDPDLTMYHELLSDQDVETFKTLARPELRNPTTCEIYHSCGKYAPLNDTGSEIVARVSRRALQLSGLSAADCEPYNVVNYGIAGMYHEHWDPNQGNLTTYFADSIGTIMFYLSDVEEGGATAFPYLNLRVSPKKGAALFWMNELPSGNHDLWMMHISCPVLTGDKWTAVKWPRRYPIPDWCPAWRTEQGVIITEQTYINILKHRKEHFYKTLGCEPDDISIADTNYTTFDYSMTFYSKRHKVQYEGKIIYADEITGGYRFHIL